MRVANLISGEPTVGPVFAGKGLGYVVAAALFLRRSFFYPLTLLYAIALVLAYVATRDSVPVEAIGLAIREDELALIAVLAVLLYTSRTRS